ncbi:MAG: ATP-dependent zinc metalloprotease FtsH [Clostridia bacterium]|nr:ATP-dependent zinc metalloprotease FtsH [Clostridia bacterium]
MNEKKQSGFKVSYLILGFLLLILICFIFADVGDKGIRLTSTEARSLLSDTGFDVDNDDKVEHGAYVYVKDGKGYILIKDSKISLKKFPTYSDYYFTYEDVGLDFVLDTAAADVQVIDAPAGTSWTSYIFPVLYIVFGLFLVFMLFRMLSGSNKSAMSFGKTRARTNVTTKVRFADIAGMDEEKAELQEIVEFLKNPQKFTNLGARIPKGVLLVGRPGTGKTLLARAVAGESKVPFISISGSDFVEMFVGVGASRVRDLFEQAKKNKPCIVFIDEIDAVGRQRGAGLGGGNDEREQTLNQLLVEMDGFEANEGIIVLAATNRSDVLDPALMRPGRFDRQVYVNIPDVKGREGILRIHARNKPLDESVDFQTLARITTGFTGADIENMLNEAAILAARANRPKIIMTDITEGINKVIMGPQKKSRLVTERDRNITAIHESGHAILGKKLKHCEDVQEVSIIPRGHAGGYTMSRPVNDDSYMSYNKIMDEIAMCMGGRIAEELIFKDVTTGASGDIQQATKLAEHMIFDWGMSKKLGFRNLSSSDTVFIGRDYQTKNNYSDKLASEADEEIKSILQENYKRAKKILTDNIDLLKEMAKLLQVRETIYTEEVDMLLKGYSTEKIVKIMEEKERKQKEKEEKITEDIQKTQKLEEYRRKVLEGEKLLQLGIITQEEYNKIKEDFLIKEHEYNVSVSGEDKPEVTEPAQNTVEEKPANEVKKTTRKTTSSSSKPKTTSKSSSAKKTSSTKSKSSTTSKGTSKPKTTNKATSTTKEIDEKEVEQEKIENENLVESVDVVNDNQVDSVDNNQDANDIQDNKGDNE